MTTPEDLLMIVGELYVETRILRNSNIQLAQTVDEQREKIEELEEDAEMSVDPSWGVLKKIERAEGDGEEKNAGS